MRLTASTTALSLMLLASPQRIEALSCRAPDDHLVVYPAQDGQLIGPKDPILIYQVFSHHRARLALFDPSTGRKIKTRVEKRPTIQLLILRPRRALKVGRAYELRSGKKALRRVVVAKASTAKPPPKAQSVTVVFGAVTRMAWHGYRYVPGHVTLSFKADEQPAAVGFEVQYGAKGSARRTRRFTLPYTARLAFSRGELCSRWSTGHAPTKGPYELRITPIGSNGQLGAPILGHGTIAPAPKAGKR